MVIKNIRIILLAVVVVFLQACGTVHVTPTIASDDLNNYEAAYISEINIKSKEQHEGAINTNNIIAAYAEQRLIELLMENKYTIIKSESATDTASLAFKLDLDIIYGSRAARYWAGFGAGKGSVRSIFEVVDGQSGDIKYRAVGESDLSVGALGGSMEAVIKQNIDGLIDSYRVSKE